MGGLAFPGIDAVISQFEGFGTANAPTITNANNPGAITAGPWAIQNGATGSVVNPSSGQSFATFPDITTGLQAEDNLVSQAANQGATLSDLIAKWAPPNAPGNSQTATTNYTNTVANQLGVSPSTPVSSLAGVTAPNTPLPTGTATTGPSLLPSSSTLGNIANGVASAVIPGYNAISNLSSPSISWGRIAAFLLGLILIGAGLFMFKTTQTIIQTGVRAGRGVASLAT